MFSPADTDTSGVLVEVSVLRDVVSVVTGTRSHGCGKQEEGQH